LTIGYKKALTTLWENAALGRVPTENLLGEEGKGLSRTLDALTYGRLSLGSNAPGLSRACVEESLRYARERVQFGRPISKEIQKRVVAKELGC